MSKSKKKVDAEPAWRKDPRYCDNFTQATIFRVVLDGDRNAYLRLRNTFDWWRRTMRMMDYFLSGAESAMSVIEPGRIKAIADKQKAKRQEAASKRIAAGESTLKEEAEKEKKAAKVKPSAEEVGFRVTVFNAAAKVAELSRQGVDTDSGMNILNYEMRNLFFRENEKAQAAGCLPVASYIWDQARIELSSIRDKEMSAYGGAKRSWMVVRGVLGNIQAQNANIPFTRTYDDHISEFGDAKGKRIVDGYDPVVKFVEEGKTQYISLRISKNPDVRLKLIVTGTVMVNGKEWVKTPPESVRNMFHRFATGRFPAFTVYLNLDAKGRLSFLVTYLRPPKVGAKDRSGEMDVVFKPLRGDELPPPRGKKQQDALNEMERVKDMQYVIHCLHRAKTGREYVERIAANAVIDRINTFDTLKRKKEFERDSQRYFPKRQQKRLDDSIRGYTKQRELLGRDVNHQWTKTLIHKANKWNVAKINIYNMPESTGLLLDERYPWQWYHFRKEIESKAGYYGFKLEFKVEKNMDSLYDALRSTFDGDSSEEKENGEEKDESGFAAGAV